MNKITKKDYHKAEKIFFDEASTTLGESLLLYCVTGSFGFGEPILDWSDIDILMVIENYEVNLLKIISSCLNRNKSRIHIGVTYYSLEEFNNKDYCKDPKTCHYINSIVGGKYKPRILDSKVHVDGISRDFVNKMDFVDFSKHLHQLKRELINSKNYNEKVVYKSLVVLIKIMLRQREIAFHGYEEIFWKAEESLKGYDFKFLLPWEIVSIKNQRKEDRYLEYVRFLNWLIGFECL